MSHLEQTRLLAAEQLITLIELPSSGHQLLKCTLPALATIDAIADYIIARIANRLPPPTDQPKDPR